MNTLLENIVIEEISDSNEDGSDNARICIIDHNSDLIDALSNRSLENYSFEIKDNNASNIDKSLLILLPNGIISSMRLIEILNENGLSNSRPIASKILSKPTSGNSTKSNEENIQTELKSSPNTSINFNCSVRSCGRIFTSFTDLKNHKQIHSLSHVCEYCNHKFATSYGLKSHKRTHTGEKPYPCPEISCSKKFNTSGDLQKHIRTHTGERPFHCELCSKSFTTSNIRKVHMRTHTGEKPYECKHEGCSRKFSSATNFRNHTRIHTGEKPYVCSFENCQRRFTEYSSLYKHYLVHSVTKKYVCVFCKRQYKQLSTLNIHMSTTHTDIYLKQSSEPTNLETEAATDLIYDFNNEFSEKDDFDTTVMDCLNIGEHIKEEITDSIENEPSPDEHSYTAKIWKGFLVPNEAADVEVESPTDIQQVACSSFKPVEAITKGSEAILVLTTISNGRNSSIEPISEVLEDTSCKPDKVKKNYRKPKKSNLME